MVNAALFEQFLRLSAEEQREFVRAAQSTVGEDVPEHVLAEVRRRIAELGPEPATDYVTLEDDEREVRSRRLRVA